MGTEPGIDLGKWNHPARARRISNKVALEFLVQRKRQAEAVTVVTLGLFALVARYIEIELTGIQCQVGRSTSSITKFVSIWAMVHHQMGHIGDNAAHFSRAFI